jgi:hypothetical protein
MQININQKGVNINQKGVNINQKGVNINQKGVANVYTLFKICNSTLEEKSNIFFYFFKIYFYTFVEDTLFRKSS